jgi:outer membrane protein TolC
MFSFLLKAHLLGLLLLALTLPKAYSQDSDSVLVLDDVIRKVMHQNPELQAAHEEWRASKTRISQAEALPDPTLGLNLMNLPVNSFALNQEPMTGKQITIMQPFPFPGKRMLKGEVAEKSAEIALLKHKELQNQLLKEAKKAYYDLYYIDQAEATIKQNQAVLQDFIEIAETRYSVGNGLQQDVLRAQVAHSKMIDQELKFRQQREAAQAQLNALMNEPANQPLAKVGFLAPATSKLTLDTLIQMSAQFNPTLAAWQVMKNRSDRMIDLAQRGRYPDFAVGLAYTQRGELQNGMKRYDFISAMFNIKIPLYRSKKQDQKVQETKITRNSVAYRYENVERMIEQKLQQALTKTQKNQRLLELYQTGIIPQAEESLGSSKAGYQNGSVDFLSLLDSELTLFQFQLDYHRFLADYYKALAELEALTGTHL